MTEVKPSPVGAKPELHDLVHREPAEDKPDTIVDPLIAARELVAKADAADKERRAKEFNERLTELKKELRCELVPLIVAGFGKDDRFQVSIVVLD